ncbi:FG-GAP repeat domain-containing protein [Streptomyces sp. NPDC048297]|uniref:FG-GAP repeat domain-containing protein n=1 Tax=Streptomyces sp. NPDC048297 TaxID=3365531 RepID=UPI00371877C7
MARHGFVRTHLVAACAALAAGLGTLLPPGVAAAQEAPQETVVPATLRNAHISATLFSGATYSEHDGAGAQGVFHRLEGQSGLVWTRYADGRSVPVAQPEGVLGTWATSDDVLVYRYSGGRVDLWNATDGTTRTIQVPSDQGLFTAYGDLAVGYHNVTGADGSNSREMHLLFPEADGTTRDVPVGGLPEGVHLLSPMGGDATGMLFSAVQGQQRLWVMVDRKTGQAQSWTAPDSHVYLDARVTSGHVVLFNISDATVRVLDRSDLSAPATQVTLGGSGVNPAQDLAVVGDWLVHRPSGGTRVTAQPIAGGPGVTVLPASNAGISAARGGTAVAIGRTGTDDWGIQRIQPGPDGGAPVVTQVKPLPKPPYRIQGISLDQGRLVVTDYGGSYGDSGGRVSRVRTVAPAGTPEFGESSPFLDPSVVVGHCASVDIACASLHGTPDGQIAWLERGTSGYSDRIRVMGTAPRHPFWERGVTDGGRITDVSGHYVLYTGQTHQYVYRIGNAGIATVSRTPSAAALSGDLLWTPAASPGTLTAYNLSTKATTETVTTDAGCTPSELQALGRWIYWACDGRAGVYDRTSKRSVPVPADEAGLGDGYVVTHDKQAGELVLTAFPDGTPVSRVIGELPDTGVSQRDVRWTVDESGGNVAYVDDQERVHLVPSGVPQQPLRLLAPVEKVSYVEGHEVDTTPGTLATVLLSKPSSGWDLTVRNRATGKVYDDGRDGGSARGELTVGWHGDDPTKTGDVFVPNGTYDWTLTVTPADGVGAPLQVRGSVQLQHGGPVRHDHVGSGGPPDGTADLLTLNPSGTLTFQQGTGKGTFSGKVSGGGWSTKALAVPFGDLDGDRCNDVLVRMSDGSLRGYRVACGLAPKPSMAYKKLGTGWNAYNVLTSPGDLTGDGRADLLARKASTGDVYLFAAKSDGTLAAGKKIRSAWTGYTKVVGAGDLNGDGRGDVLARDKAGTLWRYNGTGTGLLKDRVKVASNWGASYNAVVGVGDITGDGRSDLVVRDTSGNLYRQSGDGKGSFAARVKIATGWQPYKGLF